MEKIKSGSGSFKMAIYVAAGMLALGFVLNLLYRKPGMAPIEKPAAAIEPAV